MVWVGVNRLLHERLDRLGFPHSPISSLETPAAAASCAFTRSRRPAHGASADMVQVAAVPVQAVGQPPAGRCRSAIRCR